MSARRSRVPDGENLSAPFHTFLDAMDRRQLAVADIEDLATSPTNEEIAAKINEILAAHRTR